MSGCFLFFRFWPGFDFDQFPVDLFNGIADEDLPAALACYAGEEIRRPEVRHRIKEVVKARRQKLIAGFRKESASRMMVGARDVGVRKRLTKRDWYWPRIRRAERGDLLVCRLGAYLGWWQKGEAWSESLPFGPQVWFSRVSSPELAEAFVSHLNGRTGLDYDGNEVELHFRPRFGFVEDADTALQISAQRCINAIGRGQAPDVRGSKAALAMGRKAMAIADEMLEATAPPTPVQAVSTPPLNNDDESKTALANNDRTESNASNPYHPADGLPNCDNDAGTETFQSTGGEPQPVDPSFPLVLNLDGQVPFSKDDEATWKRPKRPAWLPYTWKLENCPFASAADDGTFDLSTEAFIQWCNWNINGLDGSDWWHGENAERIEAAGNDAVHDAYSLVELVWPVNRDGRPDCRSGSFNSADAVKELRKVRDVVTAVLRDDVAIEYSDYHTPTYWRNVFAVDGVDISQDTLTKMFATGELRKGPGGSTRRVRIDIRDLPKN